MALKMLKWYWNEDTCIVSLNIYRHLKGGRWLMAYHCKFHYIEAQLGRYVAHGLYWCTFREGGGQSLKL